MESTNNNQLVIDTNKIMNNNNNNEKYPSSILKKDKLVSPSIRKDMNIYYSNIVTKSKAMDHGITKGDIIRKDNNNCNFFLSPFYPCKFKIGDIVYKSVIHFMQSEKYRKTDPEYSKLILSMDSPMDALRLGQHKLINDSNKEKLGLINHYIMNSNALKSDDWVKRRVSCMICANYCKFRQNPKLKEALLKTKNYTIIEDTLDYFWGRGKLVWNSKNMKGLNKSGKSLMIVRDMILYFDNKERRLEQESLSSYPSSIITEIQEEEKNILNNHIKVEEEEAETVAMDII